MPRKALCLLALLPLAPTGAQPVQEATRPVYKGPLGVAVDAEGRRAYVALHTAGAVAFVDLRAKQRHRTRFEPHTMHRGRHNGQ